MIERAKPRLVAVPLLLLAMLASTACATGGKGSNPPLSTEPAPTSTGPIASAGDDSGGGLTGSDASDPDAGAPGDDGGGTGTPVDPASTCNDALHGLRAIFVVPAMPCMISGDCRTGMCCFVGGSGSTCVMQ